MKLSDFNILDDNGNEKENLKDLVLDFNRTVTDYPRKKTVHALFSQMAAITPDANAVINGDKSLTYRELELQSNQLARFLIDRGLQSESLVGIMLEQSFELVVSVLGILKAGGAYLPIDYDAPLSRIEYMLQDSDAHFLISEKAFIRNINKLQWNCPKLEYLLCLDSIDIYTEIEEESGLMNEEVWDFAGQQTFDRHKYQFDRRILDAYSYDSIDEHSHANGLAYVIYTSGTTGRPKGVMIEHHSITRLVVNTNYIQLDSSDRILQTGSLAFDASTFEIWGVLLNGGIFCRPPERAVLDATEMKRLVKQYNITTMWMTASLFNQQVDMDISMFNGLKYLLVGGEKLSTNHVNKVKTALPDLVIINGYGPTENTTFTACHRIDKLYQQDIPIGKPVGNTQVLILDTKNELVPVGVAGEICAAGDGLARGYLNDPILTSEKFIYHPVGVGDRVYRTGDLGRWLPDGAIEFLGRKDDQIKVRGYRIEPGEVESHILQHVAVKEAVVIARDFGTGSKELLAYVTLQEDLDVVELREYLKNRLVDYMAPSYFTKLEKLPLTPNGKVNKKALPTPDMNHQLADCQYEAPKSETEKQLALIWEEVLGHKCIGVKDNFFDIGGHSLKVAKLIALIHKHMAIQVDLATLFKASTIREQAQHLLDLVQFGIKEVDEAMILLGGKTSGPNIFALPPVTGDAIGYLQLAQLLKPYNFYGFNFIIAEMRLSNYADLIISVDPDGPYLLLGYSAGGNLAFHVAKELENRGRRVSDIIMVDSGQTKEKIEFPEGEAQRVAEQFLNHKSIAPYLTTPVLKEKIIRNIKCYYAHISNTVDTHIVDANIHLLYCEDSQNLYMNSSGRVIVSKQGWTDVTRGTFKTYQADGDHNHMLYPPHLETNVGTLRQILAQAV